MKRATTIAVVLTLAVVLCFALVSVPTAEANGPPSKPALCGSKHLKPNPIWQITKEGTAKSVKWVDAANPWFCIYDPNGDSTDDPTTWVDDAVLDKETGYVWERSPDPTYMSWYNAVARCYEKELAHRRGCRLPTIEELASLVDPTKSSPALPSGHPFNVQSSYYWSSTSSPGTNAADNAWGVMFD